MNKFIINKKLILFLAAITIFSLCIFSCGTIQKKTLFDNKQFNMQFDGKYNVTFVSQGYFRAVTDFEIESGILDGAIVNTSNHTFFIKGSVLENGHFSFKSIQSSFGASITASGKIKQNSIVEGHYKVGNRNGKYYGFKYSDSDKITTRYDGKYSISFHLGDQQTAITEIIIKNGAFQKNIQTITSEIFPIQGRINDQGTVILTTSIGDHLTGIAASGSIDKNRKVAGTFFTNQGEKGSFSGKLIR
ncbi:secreted protein [Candidatus Magnetomorum sp. HK-1]|nr:secreted protein [Candidatus Magnetomorum sp. HK-1]